MTWNEMLKHEQFYKDQLATFEKLCKQQTQVTQQIEHAMQQINEYEQDLQAVRKKLNKLEQFSFINALRNITGKKDRLLEENLERAAVQELKLTESQLVKEDLQDDLVEIVYRMNAINEPYIQEQLETLRIQKKAWLGIHMPHIAEKLEDIVERNHLFVQLKKEIEEAITAGKTAVAALNDAYDALKSAKNYSTWDLVGGGLIATMLKHDELEKSNNYAHKAHIAIQRFQNELLDIQNMKTSSLKIDIDGFVKFADYFFDDIFSEWSVHSKINSAKMQIVSATDDIQNTLAELGRKLAHVEHEQELLQEEKEKLLSKDEQALFLLK